MTDEELNALVRDAVLAADCMQETGTFETGQGILHDCARAITTLRAQLAEARAENEKRGREVNVARYGQPDFAWSIHKEALADEAARADRAEAALAAQIEVDAAMFDNDMNLSKQICCNGQMCGCRGATAGEYVTHAIRNQPHDRTALDRHDAKTREKALREAAQACDWGDIYGDNAVRTIIALIEKEKTK